MLSCDRSWCEHEAALHLGDCVVVEHSAIVERIACGSGLLMVRVVAIGDDPPTVVVDTSSPHQDTTETLGMDPPTSRALGSALVTAHNITDQPTRRPRPVTTSAALPAPRRIAGLRSRPGSTGRRTCPGRGRTRRPGR